MTSTANKSDLPQTLFSMKRPGREGSLLFFPDFGGNNLYARPLVAQLGNEISCYGLRFSADMIKSFHDFSIRDIALQFAKDIIVADLTRPIHLLGYSFAAALAFETGCMMEQLGSSPENIWILDLPAPVPFRAVDLLHNPSFHLKLTYRQLRRNWRGILLGKPDPMILQRYGVIGFDLTAHPEAYRFIIRHLYAAHGRYTAQPSSVPLTLLRADKNGSRRTINNDLGWGNFARGPLTTQLVPGDHLSMLRNDRNANVIAKLISASFAEEHGILVPDLDHSRIES